MLQLLDRITVTYYHLFHPISLIQDFVRTLPWLTKVPRHQNNEPSCWASEGLCHSEHHHFPCQESCRPLVNCLGHIHVIRRGVVSYRTRQDVVHFGFPRHTNDGGKKWATPRFTLIQKSATFSIDFPVSHGEMGGRGWRSCGHNPGPSGTTSAMLSPIH